MQLAEFLSKWALLAGKEPPLKSPQMREKFAKEEFGHHLDGSPSHPKTSMPIDKILARLATCHEKLQVWCELWLDLA